MSVDKLGQHSSFPHFFSAEQRQRIKHLLRTFEFKTIFIEILNWDRIKQPPVVISLQNQEYILRPLAQKRQVVVYLCDPDANGKIPPHTICRTIEKELTRQHYEHLIIYTDKGKQEQFWQLAKREAGKSPKSLEHRYHKNQDGESLVQKLSVLVFALEEEEDISTIAVSRRLNQAFDVDRITNTFFEQFKIEHDRFLSFIRGITSPEHSRWYTSITLCRLMLVYFIQKKGFLDGDEDYLSHRLQAIQEQNGKDAFFSFYRAFLLRLFHHGLGSSERPPELKAELGDIPYLNGGLFEKHALEEQYEDIQIADEAFEQIFAFFKKWHWHLDDRPLSQDQEVNPDMLGYIFEKFTNDSRKEMGAYYTSEDITDYIAKNSIIPFLFTSVAQQCPDAFLPDSFIWQLLRTNPDRYIYTAMQEGAANELPPVILSGYQNATQRSHWQQSASPDYALPTETWREVVTRRSQYEQIRQHIVSDQIHTIDQLITCNLNIRRFARDVLESCEEPVLLHAFYTGLSELTILDPTSGSGSFLLASMNVIAPLYTACIQRMQALISKRKDTSQSAFTSSTREEHFHVFQTILDEVRQHANSQFFVIKSIIVNNIYGVDISKEVVEICKLRLFLKLLAQIDDRQDLEPLPDVDFHIRVGNSLVGFITHEEALHVIASRLDFRDEPVDISEKMQAAQDISVYFNQLQTQKDCSSQEKQRAKKQLDASLKEVGDELDRYLASQYASGQSFAQWVQSHQPFHWHTAFPSIIQRGGFHVILGNPPYVEYERVRKSYNVSDYHTLSTGNLYALTIERSTYLLAPGGRFGMIVPSSATCTDGYQPLQDILLSQSALHIASFSDQRGRLFDIPHPRLCIILFQKQSDPEQPHSRQVFTTPYLKLDRSLRDTLFERLAYTEVTRLVRRGIIPRYSSPIEHSIHEKLHRQPHHLSDYLCKTGQHKVYYTRKLSWYVQVTPFIPLILDEQGKRRDPSELKILYFTSAIHADIAFVALNSNLFYWFITTGSDCRNLNMREVRGFPIAIENIALPLQDELCALATRLAEDIQTHSEQRPMRYDTGTLFIQCIYPKRSKAIIDQADKILAQYYGFTDEELDFLVYYDGKYR